jgi:uncharacterized protein YchJ
MSEEFDETKGIKAINGAVWNPYLKYPRNKECYCRSGKKYKKCCLSTEPLAVPKEVAEVAKSLIESLIERLK